MSEPKVKALSGRILEQFNERLQRLPGAFEVINIIEEINQSVAEVVALEAEVAKLKLAIEIKEAALQNVGHLYQDSISGARFGDPHASGFAQALREAGFSQGKEVKPNDDSRNE